MSSALANTRIIRILHRSTDGCGMSACMPIHVARGAPSSPARCEKREHMRKIIVGAQVSMDGVMQAPGGPTEDPTNGFKFGGWVMPYLDHVFGAEIDRA